jgi:HEAT repeat protein
VEEGGGTCDNRRDPSNSTPVSRGFKPRRIRVPGMEALPSIIMFSFYLALVAVQAWLVVMFFAAAIVARVRVAAARRDLARAADGETCDPRRLARAAWLAVANAPASRRSVLPPAEAIAGMDADLIEVLRNAVTVIERQKRHGRADAVATGALLLLARSSGPHDANGVFRSLFLGRAGIMAHSALTIGLSAHSFAGSCVVLMSVLRSSRGLGSSTMIWAIEMVFAHDPDQLTAMSREPEARLRALIVRCAGRAARSLSGATPAEPYRMICRAALRDSDDLVRASAARALKGMADAASVSALSSALRDPAEDVQIAAADSLAATRQAPAILLLAETLLTANTEVRHRILASVGDSRPIAPPELLQWLSSDDGARIDAALDLLAVCRAEQRVIDAMFSAISRDDVLSTRSAAKALAALVRSNAALFRSDVNFDRMAAQLHNDDAETVGSVIEALALTGDERIIAPFMGRISTSGRYIREKIVEGLALLELMKDRAAIVPAESPTIILRR